MTKQHIFIIENNLQKVGQSFFYLSRRTTVIQDLLVRHQFSLVPDNRTNVNVEACVYNVIRFCEGDCPFQAEANVCRIFVIICLHLYCRWRSNDAIIRFNPATYLPLSQAKTWISNAIICRAQWFESCSFCGYWWNC